jgi:membrane-bound lytic murein transglycosylase A
LIQQGLVSKEEISMQKIRQWLEANPASIDEVLNTNPSYVFFRDDHSLQSHDGARGALGLPLTPARSIAIDATVHPNGVPFYISAPHPQAGQPPIQRLVVAQDTGGAIKGGVRADFYTGSGDAAGELAGVMKQPLQMWIVLPR